MNLVKSLIAALILSGMVASGLFAQQSDAPETTAATDTTAVAATTEAADAAPAVNPEAAHQVRSDFSRILRDHPREVATVLVFDPSLLTNQEYLSRYPAIARFVAEHPEIQRNPHFYVSEFQARRNPPSILRETLEGIGVYAIILTIFLAFVWLIRTVIEQRRWNRLSRTQSEVHNKILDRFGTTAELLEYVKSPAGAKFLESAPIALHPDRPSPNPPLQRALWSIQIGVIVGAAALGMLLVSLRFPGDEGSGLFAMGVIILSIGLGFIASAAVSILLSRKFELFQPPQTYGDSEGVR